MKYVLFFLLFISASCTKYASVSRDSVGIHIAPIEMDISYLTEIPWHIGMHRDTKVTQSFTFTVDLPKIKKEDLEYLTQHKGIDSWILRLIVKRSSETQDLGSLFVQYHPRHSSRASSSSTSATKVAFKVYYAAAYASERFRSFKCPAFGHSKRIDKMDIEGPNDEFQIQLGQSIPYGEKPQLVELNPSSFNAGNSAIGEYWIEIAPYDSKNKMLHAPFKRIPRHVVVYSEEIVSVKSCDGIKMENDL